MAVSVPVFYVFCVYILLSPATVTCSKEHLKGRGLLASTEEESPASAYANWIASVRLKHELKLKASSLVGEPGMVQPDLSLDFPGMKQYVDWESVVTPATYIIVDQTGLGNFLTLTDAINSIPRDRYRQYRITIQVNAGVYRY